MKKFLSNYIGLLIAFFAIITALAIFCFFLVSNLTYNIYNIYSINNINNINFTFLSSVKNNV